MAAASLCCWCLCLCRTTTTQPAAAAGEAEEDGYEDEYQLEEVDVTFADYIKPIAVANFRKAWEDMGEDNERADDYGLGQREGLQVGAIVRLVDVCCWLDDRVLMHLPSNPCRRPSRR
jgi:hypothetical protein